VNEKKANSYIMIWATSRSLQQGGHLLPSDEHCDSLSHTQTDRAPTCPTVLM